MTGTEGLLTGIRVVEVADQYAAYAGRVLSDLGADVIRLIPSTGDCLSRHEPLDPATGCSYFYEFINANKRSVRLDLSTLEGRGLFQSVAQTADIVIETIPTLYPGVQVTPSSVWLPDSAKAWVAVRNFGDSGPYANYQMEDMLTQAMGGLMALSGHPDKEPLRLFGTQTAYIAGVHAASAALIGFMSASALSRISSITLSVHEAIAFTLETAVQYYTTEGVVRLRKGGAQQAGDGTYEASDGMVVLGCMTDREWDSLVKWLGGRLDSSHAEAVAAMSTWELTDRRDPAKVAHFALVFESYARGRTRQELYRDGQSANVLIAPVNSIPDLIEDPQLSFENWFRRIGDSPALLFPGAPYRISGHAPQVSRRASAPGEDTLPFYAEDLKLDPSRLRALIGAGVV